MEDIQRSRWTEGVNSKHFLRETETCAPHVGIIRAMYETTYNHVCNMI